MGEVGKAAALYSDDEDYEMKVAEARTRYKQYKAKRNWGRCEEGEPDKNELDIGQMELRIDS